MESDLPFTAAVIGNRLILLVLEREPAGLNVERECALAAVVDLEPSRQELVQDAFQPFRQGSRDLLSLDSNARLVPLLHAVDGP